MCVHLSIYLLSSFDTTIYRRAVKNCISNPSLSKDHLLWFSFPFLKSQSKTGLRRLPYKQRQWQAQSYKGRATLDMDKAFVSSRTVLLLLNRAVNLSRETSGAICNPRVAMGLVTTAHLASEWSISHFSWLWRLTVWIMRVQKPLG